MFFTRRLTSFVLTLLIACWSVSARPLWFTRALLPRASTLNVATCTDPATQLVEHDCNVALLGLGGGIAGAIEFLRVNNSTTSATSGTCTVTATAVDGGTTIDISKGRLEGHGSTNGGFDNLLTACGPSPGSMVIGGGAKPTGNIQIAISAA
ncbi:hypothetical protein EV361DRAFT_948009 [Lentinula raphanica]|uniref:Uncharacterized protein n=1 Tax=Lentinula raphanica TaxID=153919 RepID=A0AA38PG32_9AGAR|nr:hypothetical protein F5880DRAFT_1527644 [Lentinula raphanica]KAJ3842239.1 hypothetical protein F5878DRAFT_657785 [Lentinula raphanica]KAJ3973334.1 hypothetical protein EV361DRAFT_948009 [Lentinula raphanica]